MMLLERLDATLFGVVGILQMTQGSPADGTTLGYMMERLCRSSCHPGDLTEWLCRSSCASGYMMSGLCRPSCSPSSTQYSEQP